MNPGQHQPADLGADQAGDTAAEAGEGAVDRAEQLVLERGPGPDPPLPVGHPGGQLSQRRGQDAVASAVPGAQQVTDRHQVQRVGLQPPPPGHLALAGYLGRVDLDQLPFLRQDTRADQRLVIVPGGLDADADQPDRSAAGRYLYPLDQQPHAGHGHRELKRAGQQLPGEVAHQRHRGALADINRNRDQLRRVDTTGRLSELLGLSAMDMHHEPTTSVRCEGELALPPMHLRRWPEKPPFYIRARRPTAAVRWIQARPHVAPRTGPWTCPHEGVDRARSCRTPERGIGHERHR